MIKPTRAGNVRPTVNFVWPKWYKNVMTFIASPIDTGLLGLEAFKFK